jgi:hypothetical protein
MGINQPHVEEELAGHIVSMGINQQHVEEELAGHIFQSEQ